MSDQTAPEAFFAESVATGFGTCLPSDELLHRDAGDTITDEALTETQYLGFSVPEAGVHALKYVWHHPNLGVVSGGVWAWQGHKRGALTSEVFDMRTYVDDADLLKSDLAQVLLPNGYRVEVVRPLEELRATYVDEARDSSFDVTFTAVSPPVMLSTGHHFDQVMRTSGEVRLRGRTYRVDGHTVRDRSWGEARGEQPRPMPPMHWLAAVFSDDLAVQVTVLDEGVPEPVWAGTLEWDPAGTRAFNRGWVWRGGELRSLERVSVLTRWDRSTGHPARHEVRAVDCEGQPLLMTGTPVAGNDWNTWHNASSRISLTRWEMGGQVGWGDSQSALWTDMAHALQRG